MGAQMDFREVFFLQVATELELAAEGGCSAVGAAQSTVGPFVGQNWDQPPGAYETQIVLRLCPNDGPRIMMFARAGIVGYIGVNSSGVGHVCNQLYSSSPPGLTGYFLMRKFLSFDSVDKAVSWLDAIKIGSCGNYLLGDSTGTLLDLELGGGTVQQMRETVLCHTNHYVAADSDGVDECHSRLPDSVHRYDRLVSVFGMSGRFEDAIRALKDHSGYPASVCRHGACGMSTAASIVIKLREREMLVCEGNPCLGRYTSFRL